MKKAKTQNTTQPMTDDEKIMCWLWSCAAVPDSTDWEVFAWGPLPKEAGVRAERVVIARCASQRIAREILANRQIADAATNWIGLLNRKVSEAFLGDEATKYRDAWRRAGRPLESETQCENALLSSPVNPPDPYGD